MTGVGRQIDRLAALLRDVKRSGGRDVWDHLKSHGHHRATVRSAIDRGYLRELVDDRYELTDDADAFFVWHSVWSKVKNA